MLPRRHIAMTLRVAADVLLIRAASKKATSGFAAALNDVLHTYEAGTGGESGVEGEGNTDLSKVEFKHVLEILERVAKAFKPMGLGAKEDFSTVPWFKALNDAQQTKLRRVFGEAHDLLNDIREEQKKGPEAKYALGGHQRNVSRLREFVPKLRAIDKLAAAHEEREQHGPFTLISLPGVTRNEYSEALTALDAAANAMKAKFPQVLYGDVYLKTAIRHSGQGAAAAYDFTRDYVHLNVNAKHRVNDVFSIVHEFGHRYDNKFLKDGPRAEFEKLFKQGMAVTDYGGKDVRENFAEGFAHYVLNMSLAPEFETLFDSLT